MRYNGGRDRGRSGGRFNEYGGRSSERSGRFSEPYRQSKGMIETLPFLDYKSGKSVSAEKLQDFLEKMKIYSMANHISGLECVFEDEGVYPDFPEPDLPENEQGVPYERWKMEFKDFKDNIKKLKVDKVKLFGETCGQLSKTSLDRIKQCEVGVKAFEEKCPLLLVKGLISTHMIGGKVDDDQNFYTAKLTYDSMKMNEHGELLDNYFNRFNAILIGLSQAAIRAGEAAAYPSDQMQALHFVNTVSQPFQPYGVSMSRKILDKPKTLQEAYEAIVEFGPTKGTRLEPRAVGAFVARGRGGRGYRGGQGGRTGGRGNGRYGGRGGRGACVLCHEYGHWKNECPLNTDHKPNDKPNDKADIDKAIQEIKDGGGKKANKP